MRRVWLTCVVVQVLLGAVASKIYLTQHNTLHANGRWVSTKTQLERGLMGAYSFVTERQSLAGGSLNLGAWHGNQEVFYRRPLAEVESIEFDVRLGAGGYIVAFFDLEPEGDAEGVRLGTDGRHPGAFLRVAADGEFLDKAPLAEPIVEAGRWHRVRLDVEPARVTAWLGDRELGTCAYRRRADRRVGFRGGGSDEIRLDNVEIGLVDGVRLSDDFDSPRSVAGLALAVSAVLIALNALLYALLRRFGGGNRKTIAFSFLMVNLTLLVIGGVLFVFVFLRAGAYPGVSRALREAEEYFGKGTAEQVVEEIRSRYLPLEASPGESEESPRRVLFLGTSQTWGAGARREEDTFVSRVESMLNAAAGGGRRYECINAGFSSLEARDLVSILDQDLLAVRPDVLVINLSSNDRGNRKSFQGSMRKMVESARRRGVPTLLVKEANEPASWRRGLLARHAELEQVGREFDLPVIDMNAHLAALEDTGFLWWDHVHLTVYGQRLIAEKLAAELRLALDQPQRPRTDGVEG